MTNNPNELSAENRKVIEQACGGVYALTTASDVNLICNAIRAVERARNGIAPPVPAEVEDVCSKLEMMPGRSSTDLAQATLRAQAAQIAELQYALKSDEFCAADQGAANQWLARLGRAVERERDEAMAQRDNLAEQVKVLREALDASRPYVFEEAADGYPPAMTTLTTVDVALAATQQKEG